MPVASITIFLLRFLLVAACLWGGHQLLAEAHLHEAMKHVRSLDAHSIIFAVLGVIVSYAMLVAIDWLGLRLLKQNLELRAVAFTACLANAISNVAGFALLSGGAIRMRCYTAYDVKPSTIIKVGLFCTVTFLVGLIMVASVGMAFDSGIIAGFAHLSHVTLRAIGCILLAIGCLLPFLGFVAPRLHFRARTWQVPSTRFLLAQFAVSIIDILAVAGILYELLPAETTIGFLPFALLFSAALGLGVISSVPGGLGVFEAVIIAALSGTAPASKLFGALLAYRFVYYIVPFLFAILTLLWMEIRQSLSAPMKKLAATLAGPSTAFLPALLAIIIAMAGMILLVSGATPAAPRRLDFLTDYLPLGVVEASHLLGSLIGLALLLIARGVYYRLDSAYAITLLLLVAGIIFSLAKGFDYEEGLALSGVLVLVYLSRRQFYRRSKISMIDIGWGWFGLVACSVAGVIWLVFFAYKHVEYDNYLWWQVALGIEGDASRSLRSVLLISIISAGLGLYQLFRPTHLEFAMPTDGMTRVKRILASAKSTNASLALTGDKYFIFSTQDDAFIMFRQIRRSIVAMGDPVGNADSFPELIWQFRTLADQYQYRAAFYEASAENLPLFVDSGFHLARLGEEALIDLASFSLDGPRYRGLRQAVSKATREGFDFTMLAEKADTATNLAALESVSTAWLRDKQAQEKGFSLGSFTADYVTEFPIAVVRQHGQIVAFANVLTMPEGDEMSVDLMRYRPGTPAGAMDYLFASLLVHGKEKGYRYFNLGMAPLAGFNTHRLAPLWTKLGAFIYRYGEKFYNFQGIYAFKRKYHPHWRPRYLAYTGASAFMVLFDVALLIAGGFKGLFKK